MPSFRTVKDIGVCCVPRLTTPRPRSWPPATPSPCQIATGPPPQRPGLDQRRGVESARADRESLYAVYVLILVLGLRTGEARGLTEETVCSQASSAPPGCAQAAGRESALTRGCISLPYKALEGTSNDGCTLSPGRGGRI